MSEEKYQTGEPPCPVELPVGTITSSDVRRPERIPPGQSRTRKWPVLDASGTPALPTADAWRLEVCGLVARPQVWTLSEFGLLPRTRVFADFHCVTRWSRLGNLWEGVSTGEISKRAGVLPSARFVILHGYDQGWTTNLPLSAFQSEDALLADRHDGQPLSDDHGGPVRAIIPRLYAWKSAKWIKMIEFAADDQPGYWERLGYHEMGDPWVQDQMHIDGQRFQTPDHPPPGAE